MASVLTMQQFLERVWPDQGPYIIAYPIVTPNGNKAYAHRCCVDIDDAVAKARDTCIMKNQDTFFCVHALVEGKKFNPTTQRWKTSRKHENMREGKCFFFDLDVGTPTKDKPKYNTREEALASLQRFLFLTGLPDPLVVSSGGGYHVYWVLSAPIPSLEWRAYADRMRWLAFTNGLIVDPTRTTDQSSVLRVVGTKNLKPHVMAKVTAIAEGEISQTTDFLDMLRAKTEKYTPLATLVHTAANHTGNMGTMFDGRMTPADEVFEVCEQMRTFRDSLGNLPEPAWFASVGTMRWVDDGEALVHEISQGDPRYDEGETQAKIDHWSDKSVPSCAKIALEFGNDACDRCPLKGTGKNPLDIANKAWARAARKPTLAQLQSGAIPLEPSCDPPYGYSRGNAGVFREVFDEKQGATVQKLLMPYDLFPVAKFSSSKLEPGHSEWMVTIPITGQTRFDLTDTAFTDQREFGTSMLSNGIIIPEPAAQTQVRTYMMHYLSKLQMKAIATAVHDHYGWDYEDDSKISTKRSFVIHKRAFNLHDRKWQTAAMSGNMNDGAAFMGQDGTLEGHKQAMQFFNRPQYRHVQFAYLAGLSTPFFYATGEHGMIISATGVSGASKSATLKAIAGQWGSPERYVLSGAPDGATANARVDRMMTLANLPFTLDELTNQSSEAIKELMLGISQNGGKLRLDANSRVKIHRGGIRHSIMVCSSNTSLVTMVNAQNAAGQAELARMIEIHFPVGPKNEKTAADHAIRALRTNYGHVGPAMLEGLLPIYDEIEEAIQKRSDILNTSWDLAASERFTGGCCATMYEVAVRAYDLGLHSFDVDEVMVWLQEEQLPQQRLVMASQNERSNPIEVLATYLAQFHGEAVRVDEDGKGNLSGIVSVPMSRALAYRFDIHAKEIWIRSQHFGDYCNGRRLDHNFIIQKLREMKVVVATDRKSLVQGIPNYPTMRSMCYIVDMTHRKLAGVVAKATI